MSKTGQKKVMRDPKEKVKKDEKTSKNTKKDEKQGKKKMKKDEKTRSLS